MSQQTLERSINTLHTQSEGLGHVYVPHVYDPQLGRYLGDELDGLFAGVNYDPIEVVGDQKRGPVNAELAGKYPSLIAVLGAIGTFSSDVLGCTLWSAETNDQTLLETIDMTPVVASYLNNGREYRRQVTPVQGIWHIDRPGIKRLVAVTTYEAHSQLEFEDGKKHDLEPGGVAFFDPQLFHRGFAAVRRRALGVARRDTNPAA